MGAGPLEGAPAANSVAAAHEVEEQVTVQVPIQDVLKMVTSSTSDSGASDKSNEIGPGRRCLNDQEVLERHSFGKT